MPTVSTIKSRREFERVFSNGERFSGPLFTTLIAATPEQRDQNGRVAFAAGKRLGNAVLRNRCKRVMRAGVQRVGGPWAGWDVLFIAKRRVATASPQRIDHELARTLKKLGI